MAKQLLKLFLLVLVLCLVGRVAPAAQAERLDTDPDWVGPWADCSTGLSDGDYTPESFSFSGGTGKVKIFCDGITVQDGTAYARLWFSSSSWSYIRGNGMLCYADIVDEKATFTLPVQLGVNNTIRALTTRMSVPHEVEYTIFIQLSAAQDTGAPQIMGLSFQQALPLRCDHLRLYQYERGITLIQVDTGTQPAPAAEIPEADKIPADFVAALYHEQVLSYLLVPEGTTLPAGLEKEYLLIPAPLERVWAFPGLSDSLGPVPGTPRKPDYREIILNKIQAVVASQAILPDLLEGPTDRFATLGIPLIVDCSALEPTAEGREDWAALYQLLFEVEP